MTSSSNPIDWDQLKPRILQDLANGKTQKQIRQELAEGPFRVSISKSQLETQLRHWKYRSSLHEQEWEFIIHRINKRRKAGKEFSQVSVNGNIFDKRKLAKAISRYDTPRLVRRLPSPQIPPELSHHLIEISTPPPSYWSLRPPPFSASVAETRLSRLALYPTSSGSAWPQTAEWRKVELSVDKFVDQFFIPTYGQDEKFHDAFNVFGHELPVSRTDRGRKTLASPVGHEKSLPARVGDTSTNPHDGVPVHRQEIQGSFNGSNIHTAIVQSLVGLLYRLSKQSLGDADCKALVSIIDTPAWDTVAPHLRDALTAIDSKIVQAIAEGLLRESILLSHRSMLDLSLGLGADPTQPIQSWDRSKGRAVLFTPLAAICGQSASGILAQRGFHHSHESLIRCLLKRDPQISNRTLFWIISAQYYAIAEDVIRSQPQRIVEFSIAVSDLGRCTVFMLDGFGAVTPLVVACSDPRPSAARLSLIRCLLQRNAKADLKAMLAAAQACDEEVISLLYLYGAPVNGFIPYLGTPLSIACDTAIDPPVTGIAAIPLLLRLGASPNNPQTQGPEG